MKTMKTKSTLDSYCKKLLQQREGVLFRTTCLWSLVEYEDARSVEGYFEEWGNLDKSEKDELRYEGITEWDDNNYKQTTLDEVADNKHLKFVLERALNSNNFSFIGRLDIHSDIIIYYLKKERGLELFDFEEGFSSNALKFLKSREKSFQLQFKISASSIPIGPTELIPLRLNVLAQTIMYRTAKCSGRL